MWFPQKNHQHLNFSSYQICSLEQHFIRLTVVVLSTTLKHSIEVKVLIQFQLHRQSVPTLQHAISTSAIVKFYNASGNSISSKYLIYRNPATAITLPRASNFLPKSSRNAPPLPQRPTLPVITPVYESVNSTRSSHDPKKGFTRISVFRCWIVWGIKPMSSLTRIQILEYHDTAISSGHGTHGSVHYRETPHVFNNFVRFLMSSLSLRDLYRDTHSLKHDIGIFLKT